MNRLLLITSLIVAAVVQAMAQPAVTMLEQHHDYGVILEENGKVTCQMRVVNTGNEPLLIVKAQAGCGCTAVNYPEPPILPGDTAAVAITYNPSGRPGQFSKQVLLFTNTTQRRTLLEITGNVIPTQATLDKEYPLKAGPLRISKGDIPFGELVKGKNKTQFLSCYNASTDTIVVQVEGGQSHFCPAIVPDTVPPAMVTALTVHYHSGKAPLWGLNDDTLALSCHPLNCTAQDHPETATIHVLAQVIENFDNLTDKQRRDAPVVAVDCQERLDFGAIAAGETATRTFTVTNKGKEPLFIRRLWVPGGEGITIKADKLEVKKGKKATVTVTVNTSALQGNMLNVPLTLMTNDPDSPRYTIRLVGLIDKQ